MPVGERLAAATGEWAGSKRLRMMPTDDYRPSASRATVASAAGGNAVTVAYSWAEDGSPQEGLLLIADGESPDEVAAIWLDSWHQRPHWMTLHGDVDDGGIVRLAGSYAADAGWRISIDPGDGTALRIGMENVMPDTGAYPVVEIAYTRVG